MRQLKRTGDLRAFGTASEAGGMPDATDDGEASELTPAEIARARRRDRDARAQERAGMNPGLAKQFKQVLDEQQKRADEAGRQLKRSKRSG